MGKSRRLGALWLISGPWRIPAFVVAAVLVLLVGASAVLAFEAPAPNGTIRGLGDALWYGVVTMMAVGYGDLIPVTGGGRIVGVLLMFGGLGIVSAVTATVASILVTQRIREGRGLDTIRATGHLIVCGWNQYAERVLEATLAAAGAQAIVLVNELPEQTVSDLLLRYRGTRFVRGDPASEVTLERANVREAAAAIVLADTSRPAPDERTALVTLTLKSLRPDLVVTAEAVDLKSESHIRRAGADEVVVSGEFNAFLLSSATAAPGIPAVVRPLLTSGAMALRRVAIPPDYVGRTFGELARSLRDGDGTLLIAIVSEAKGLTLDDLLTDDTSLVDRFISDQFQQAGTEFLRFERGRMRAVLNPPDSYVIQRADAAVGITGHS
ncbi:MAG TPA: potassium channel protein [Candidatus Limnocylindria bacterium]